CSEEKLAILPCFPANFLDDRRNKFWLGRPIADASAMSEKPGDFFLGVIDFFGILVPGIALLALQGSTLAHLAAIPLPSPENWWDWVPAVVAAYVIGHFLLGLGVPLNALAAAVYPEAKDKYFQEVRNQVPVPPGVTSTRSTVFNA